MSARTREHSARRVEFAEDSGYIIRHPFQRGYYWTQPARAYIAGKVHIEVDIRIWSGELDEYADHYVIHTRVAPWDNNLGSGARFPIGHEPINGNAVMEGFRPVCECCVKRGDYKQMEPPMLVSIGQADQLGQGMHIALAGSFIRLERLDSVNVRRADVSEEPMTLEISQPSHFRELDGWGLLPGGHPAKIDDCQLPHQMVKGSPQIVDGIPEDKWPIVADLYHSVDAVDHSTLIRFVLPPKGNQS